MAILAFGFGIFVGLTCALKLLQFASPKGYALFHDQMEKEMKQK